MSLTREQILQADDIKIEKVNIPEWPDDCIYVKGLTGKEKDAWEISQMEFVEGKTKPTIIYDNMRAKLCARTICDEKGKLLFKESDIEALGDKSGSALSTIFDIAQRLSGITKDDVEKLVKNSKSAQTEGSISD